VNPDNPTGIAQNRAMPAARKKVFQFAGPVPSFTGRSISTPPL
jgi:hypothetical protein